MPERIDVPSLLIECGAPVGDHYVLRVVGNALSDEGFEDGDWLVVLRREAVAGDLVVALIGEDSTIKRYYPQPDGTVRMEPWRPNLQPVFAKAEDVRVQGIVTGMMRKFTKEAQ